MSEACDVLVLAPHPDDAEMCCGGIISKLVSAGRRVAVADLTRGEKGSRGTVEQRASEAAAAGKVLGLASRRNLGLRDAALADNEEASEKVIGVLRAVRPTLLLAPLPHDSHPDHAAAGLIAARAFFLAGLAKVHPELGTAHRPRHFLRYPLHDQVEPTLCVDISGQATLKLQAVRCYASQIGQGSHRIGLDPLERAEARDRFYGSRIGVRAAEPFTSVGPLRLEDLSFLL